MIKKILNLIINNQVEMNSKMFDKEYPVSIVNSEENIDQIESESNKMKVEDFEEDKAILDIDDYK